MLNKLTEKYWRGECTDEEEQALFKAMREAEPEQTQEELREYLQFLQEERVDKVLGDDFDTEILEMIDKKVVRNWVPANWMKAAAAIAFIASIGFGVNQLMTPRPVAEIAQVEDTFDDTALAFEEVQKALLLLSSNMNEGMKQASLLGEFEKAKEELHNKKKDKTDESN